MTFHRADCWLIDITRLLRRSDRTLTGVDRVELAYLDHFLSNNDLVFGLVRTKLGYILLDRNGLSVFRNAINTVSPDAVRRNLKLLRQHALVRCVPYQLSRNLKRHLPDGVYYFNVAHSNLTPRVCEAVKSVQDARIIVFLHDTIPLDRPEFQTEKSVKSFIQFFATLQTYADTVICNSRYTARRFDHHTRKHIPKIIAPLGVDRVAAQPVSGNIAQQISTPYFCCIGTIEPRKNHAFLLNLWENLNTNDNPPTLLICGSRGWKNDTVFSRLDRGVDNVIELSTLTDGQLIHLLQNSNGLLFPSHEEGFGLPLAEAMINNVPVIANDLAVFDEIGGSYAALIPTNQPEAWTKAVLKLCQTQPCRKNEIDDNAFCWKQHFISVFAAL